MTIYRNPHLMCAEPLSGEHMAKHELDYLFTAGASAHRIGSTRRFAVVVPLKASNPVSVQKTIQYVRKLRPARHYILVAVREFNNTDGVLFDVIDEKAFIEHLFAERDRKRGQPREAAFA
jgi:hypothetical protein